MVIFIDLLRTLCFFIDSVVYGLIPVTYKLIIYLASVNLFSSGSTDNTIGALTNRIYVLIGIFMLFKLSFSVIRYIVDPDSFTDNSKGFTNLVKRVLIALLLLGSTPWIFKTMYDLQAKIITKNVIPNLILGTKEETVNGSLNTASIESSAKDVQFLMFGPFFSINYKLPEFVNCDPTTNPKYPMANILGTSDMAKGNDDNGACINKIANLMDEPKFQRENGTVLYHFFKHDGGADDRDFGKLAGLVNWKVGNDEYAINYIPIISTIAGGYLVFLLLSFCFDIATRAIRLLILQVLSPVAIISSVDPTSSNERLNEWGKECLTTYLSLFIRLAIIFIIIEFINVITGVIFAKDIYYSSLQASNTMNIFIYIFLIIGCFQVAKKIPELIEKATGIKMSGDLSLNPFKNPFVTATAGLGLVGAGMLGANAISSVSKLKSSAAQFREDGGFEALGKDAKDYMERRITNPFKMLTTADYFTKKGRQELKDNLKENKRIRRTENNVGKFLHGARDNVSSVAGIATGAVAGATRGAQATYGKTFKDSFGAARNAIDKTTDARNDRDWRGEGSYTGNYTAGDRVSDAMYGFANVKNKYLGVGKASEDIKTAQMELDNLRAYKHRAIEQSQDASLQYNSSNITDKATRDLVETVKKLSSEERKAWLEDNNNRLDILTNPVLTDAQANATLSYLDSIKEVDSLTASYAEKEKEIKKLEDMINKASNNGSSKPGSK